MLYQPFNLVILSLAGAAMLLTGQIDSTAARVMLYCVPASVIGTQIGLRLYSGAGEVAF